MDPLSVTASIIAVLQAANAIISICCDYSAAVKGASWELPKVTKELQNLRDVLELLKALAKRAENADPSADPRLPALIRMCKSDAGPLAMCNDELESLKTKLKPPKWTGPVNSKRSAMMLTITWPLKEDETKKMLQNMERHKTALSMALEIDQTAVGLETNEMARVIQAKTLAMSEDFAELKFSFSQTKLDEKLGKWLSAPDPSSNHNEACAKRQVTTGDWFIKSSNFAKWKKDKNSLLWLHGIPGCGKTILCSTVIEDVLLESPPAAKKAVAYFYFDFRTTECQYEGMIRSLISQFATQCTNQTNPLESLYSSCSNGARQPKIRELRQTLRDLVQNFNDAFTIIDALDECKEREQLLADIQKFVGWQLEGLHILVTSRREGDIKATLDPLVNVNQNIDIQSEVVDVDIRVYVREILQGAQSLRRWRNKPLVQDEIEKALTENANGMFRWVVCQIDELKKCLNLPMLRKQLKSLPATLPQTYERMLLNIGQDYRQYALKLLQWLTYSKQPLSLLQLAEVVAIDEDEDPRFDPERRFPESEDILLICSSLVTTTEEDEDIWDTWDSTSLLRKRVKVVKVKLAHFSVQEYLVSSQIMKGPAKEYSIQEIDANFCIARDCLLYMLYITEDIFKAASHGEHDFWSNFPLAQYAAERWTEHARAGEQLNEESMIGLSMELFTSEGNAYSTPCIGKFCHVDYDEAPLYYASKNDLVGVAERLMTMGADVNARSGYYGNNLCMASTNGNTKIVKLLLGRGADPNSLKHGWNHGSALYQATQFGYDAIVRLLLDAGAKVGLEKYVMCHSALHVAARHGNANIVEMLISSGTDVNLGNGKPFWEHVLRIAAEVGNIETMRLILGAGANSSKNDALCYAANAGSDMVKLLLGAGANINQGWGRINPLQVAVQHGHATTVKILLDAGADVDVGHYWKRDDFSDSVHCSKPREVLEVLELLIAAGARIIGVEKMMKELKD